MSVKAKKGQVWVAKDGHWDRLTIIKEGSQCVEFRSSTGGLGGVGREAFYEHYENSDKQLDLLEEISA